MTTTTAAPAATVTINLEAAGLTHAKGKSDRCNGDHEVSMLSVVGIDDPSWTPTRRPRC